MEIRIKKAVLPAYAGMIPLRSRLVQRSWRAPRVCGDDPGAITGRFEVCQVLPAYAGMIRSSNACARRICGAPRVCGDDPYGLVMEAALARCSPRMRG